MYRLFSLLVLSISVSEGCGPPPCHWNNPRQIEDYFNDVANRMAAADKKLLIHCGQQSSTSIKEVHGPTTYKIVYPSAGGDTFEVKVRDHVMLVRAQNCISPIVDVRILPPYVNPRSGTHAAEAGDLVITFQYKYDPTLGGNSCVPPDVNIIPLQQQSCIGSCNNNIY